MKKQILFLAMFTMALIFAGTSTVFGQNDPLQPYTTTALTSVPLVCPAATPVVCPSDAIHPIPGNPYEYSIEVPTNLGAGATFEYRWLVTQDPNIITTAAGVTTITANEEDASGTGMFVHSADAHYNTLGNVDNKILIAWKSYVHNPALPVLVVIYVEGTDGCLTNNVEVYEIQPIHAFTLDIQNIALDGTLQPVNYATCVSPVESAIYTSGNLTMDYGTNYLYFSVTAANFTGSWLPSFQGTPGGVRSTTAIEWQYASLANIATGWHPATDPVEAIGGPNAAVGASGECIIVRWEIDNNTEETVTAGGDIVTMAVDGVMNDPATVAADYTNVAYADVHFADCAVDDFDNDHVDQILKPRPALVTSTPGVAPFPNPEPFQPKN